MILFLIVGAYLDREKFCYAESVCEWATESKDITPCELEKWSTNLQIPGFSPYCIFERRINPDPLAKIQWVIAHIHWDPQEMIRKLISYGYEKGGETFIFIVNPEKKIYERVKPKKEKTIDMKNAV